MKYIKIIFMIAGFVSLLIATENKISTNREEIYLNLFSSYDCVLGPNVNNPQWICNEEAPNGWGTYYGNIFKLEKSYRKQLVNKWGLN